MAIEGTPEYQPSVFQKLTSEVTKRAPFVIGRMVQTFSYWVYQAIQFLIQMFHDAIGR